MRTRVASFAAAGASLIVSATASAQDPAAGREQLKQGFALKEAGRCQEAVPHFLESEQLDPQPKTLINLAECQDALHQLVEAEQNLVAARDMATRPEQSTLRSIAVERLKALEARLPRLNVTPAPGVTADGLEVTRDGTRLGAVSLGTPLPTNPGHHVVVVHQRGHEDASFEVTLAEGETREIAVAPGALLETSKPPAESSGAARSSAAAPPSAAAPNGTWRTIGWVLAGVGVVGLGAGAALGGVAISRKNAATDCNADFVCGHDSVVALHDAIVAANASTVAFVVGGVALAGGATLVLTLPSGGAGVQVGGRF
jgi:hypothetical protein